MAKVSVYDTEGVAHEKEPVDARECCENLGWTMQPKVEVSPINPAEPALATGGKKSDRKSAD